MNEFTKRLVVGTAVNGIGWMVGLAVVYFLLR
jgi:hypothetical protein